MTLKDPCKFVWHILLTPNLVLGKVAAAWRGSPADFLAGAEWTQDLILSSPPQGSGPFLQAPSRVLQCLVEWLVLLQPIKLPRLVSVTLWNMP